MNTSAIAGAVIALALAALIGFGVIAAHEFSYASHHRFAYGPAKIIAWGGIAGAALAAAVALLALAIQRTSE